MDEKEKCPCGQVCDKHNGGEACTCSKDGEMPCTCEMCNAAEAPMADAAEAMPAADAEQA